MRSALFAAAALGSLLACGGDDAGGPIDAPTDSLISDPDGTPLIDGAAIDGPVVDGPAATFTLTSAGITEGGVIPVLYSCRGANVSPPLAWTGGPTAPGYAVVLTDTSNNLVHSIIWDLPGTTLALPEAVAKVAEPTTPATLVGSKQPLAYDNQTRGYLGPCPGSQHTYRFAVFAVDANPLPGVTLSSNRTAVVTAILAHDAATATLTATFTP